MIQNIPPLVVTFHARMNHACPRCGETTPGRTGRCTRCQRPKDAQRNARPNRAVYNTTRWRTLAAQVKREEPVCRDCHRRPTTCAAHIQPFTGADDPLAWDRRNIKGSCTQCNSSEAGRRAHSPSPTQPARAEHGEGAAADDPVYVA